MNNYILNKISGITIVTENKETVIIIESGFKYSQKYHVIIESVVKMPILLNLELQEVANLIEVAPKSIIEAFNLQKK